MTAKLLTTLALTAALGTSAVATSTATAAETIEANAKVKVVKTDAGRLVAKSLVTGERTDLGRETAASLVDVAGNYVGIAGRFGGRIEVRSVDARSGDVKYRVRVKNAMGLVVRRTGTIVWVTQNDTTRTVYGKNAGGKHVLGNGERIDPMSLAFAESGATTAYVYWVDESQTHRAAIE
jgi:hypothetical protein